MTLAIFSVLAIILLGPNAGLAAPASASSITLPKDLPDGVYVGDGSINSKTGIPNYTYLGPAVVNDTATVAVDSRDVLGGLQRRATVNCNGRWAGDSVGTVKSCFASAFNGYTFPGGFGWAACTAGSSRAFACNYGGPATVSSGVFWSDMGSVDSVCGSSNSGWFDSPADQLNYGRDHINYGFC